MKEAFTQSDQQIERDALFQARPVHQVLLIEVGQTLCGKEPRIPHKITTGVPIQHKNFIRVSLEDF